MAVPHRVPSNKRSWYGVAIDREGMSTGFKRLTSPQINMDCPKRQTKIPHFLKGGSSSDRFVEEIIGVIMFQQAVAKCVKTQLDPVTINQQALVETLVVSICIKRLAHPWRCFALIFRARAAGVDHRNRERGRLQHCARAGNLLFGIHCLRSQREIA